MPVIYDGKKLIAAPFVNLAKSYNTTDDGRKIGSIFNITLTGRILADRGSPDSNGTFWTLSGYPPNETVSETQLLTVMLRKQEALRKLFRDEGKTLEIQGYDGAAPLTCNPRVRSIEFPRGQPTSWAQTMDYVINLEADIVFINGSDLGEDTTDDVINYHIERFDQSYNIEAADEFERTFRLTRQLSAKGKRFFDDTGALVKDAWKNAQDYLLNKAVLGIDETKMVATGVLNNNNLQAFNYLRSQSINEAAGTCAITETWLCFDPGSGNIPAVEEFNVNTRISESNQAAVTIDGSIRGLEKRDNTTRSLISTRWDNAKSKFAQVEHLLFNRAENIAGTGLNPVVLSKVVGRNELNGTITYNYEYNNRPSTSVVGALSEVITVSFENKGEVFAQIPILGRAAGPILQSIGTTTANQKSVSIEVMVKASTYDYNATIPNTDALVNLFIPTASQVFRSRDSENWTSSRGSYSRQVSWTYEV